MGVNRTALPVLSQSAGHAAPVAHPGGGWCFQKKMVDYRPLGEARGSYAAGVTLQSAGLDRRTTLHFVGLAPNTVRELLAEAKFEPRKPVALWIQARITTTYPATPMPSWPCSLGN